jgi:hypothetical protein
MRGVAKEADPCSCWLCFLENYLGVARYFSHRFDPDPAFDSSLAIIKHCSSKMRLSTKTWQRRREIWEGPDVVELPRAKSYQYSTF